MVLVSTAFAFQGNWIIVGLRMAMTLSVAVVVGLLASALFPHVPGLVPAAAPISGGSGGEPHPSGGRAVIAHAIVEFYDVIFFIILGALFTAATQTLVPRGDLAAIGGSPVGSVITLMPIATLLSICSEADAFVARAFATTFTVGAVLAFMTIGQIIDLRNGLLLARTLRTGLTVLVVVVAYLLVCVEGVLINLVIPRL